MRRLDLWETSPPPEDALKSDTPFCYDTLEFTQWLQWVMLPRLVQLVEQRHPWPEKSDIATLAEQSFEEIERNTDDLLKLMREFDELVTR